MPPCASAQARPPGAAPAGQGIGIPFVDINVREAQGGREAVLSVQLLLLLSVLTLAPSILILMTAFLRIAIVLDFVKRALSLQQVPPNQVLMGAGPLPDPVHHVAHPADHLHRLLPALRQGRIGIEEAVKNAEGPVRLFMYRQLGNDGDNIRLFMRLRGLPRPNTLADVPTYVLIPAFVLHELTVAFKIGILLFIPFIIIDMVVASTLMSMGMIMLPPVMISHALQADPVRPGGRVGPADHAAGAQLPVEEDEVDVGFAVQLMRSSAVQTLLMAAPLLLIGMVVGLIMAIFQATTSIQEQTLTFVPEARRPSWAG